MKYLLALSLAFGMFACATPQENKAVKEEVKDAKAKDEKTDKNAKLPKDVKKVKEAAVRTVETVAGGNSAVCKQGETERHVSIVYKEAGKTLPCDVTYKKVTEEPNGEAAVLWTAQNEEGYCEQKLDFFVEKLSGLGFACAKSGEAAPAAETAAPAAQ